MKQATMTLRTIERTAALSFWVLAVAIVILASLYVYLVNKTVHNVVARQTTEVEISKLSTTLSELEFKYITAKAGVNMELASNLGFKAVSGDAQFVTREHAGKNVAVR